MENEIIQKAKHYGLRAEWVNDNLYIYSALNEWYLSYENNRLILFHKNKKGKSQLKHFHQQKTFEQNQYDKAFSCIKSHDNYKLSRDSKNRKMELFNMIESGNVPKIKIS